MTGSIIEVGRFKRFLQPPELAGPGETCGGRGIGDEVEAWKSQGAEPGDRLGGTKGRVDS